MLKLELANEEYLHYLINYNNFNHAQSVLKKLILNSKTDKVINKLKEIEEILKKSKEITTKIFAPIVVSNNGNEYPFLFPIELYYKNNETVLYGKDISQIIKKAVIVVENYFAEKGIIIDLNPNKFYLNNIEEIEHIFVLDCNSMELSVAVALYFLIINKKPEKILCLTGGLDLNGNILSVDNIEQKKFAVRGEFKDVFLFSINDNFNITTFSKLIKNVIKPKNEIVDSKFLGNTNRMMTIADMYFLKGDFENYLPIYKNLELYLSNKKDVKSQNMLFITLMRLGWHYSHSGDLKNAGIYYERANKLKMNLKKENIFEYNSDSIEFNNVYAVYLKDVYEYQKGLKILKENLKEKNNSGRHILISTRGTLAQYYIHSKDYKKAKQYLLTNLLECKKYMLSDVSRTYCYLAKLSTLKRDFKNSKRYIILAKKYIKYTNEKIQKIFIDFEELRLYSYLKNTKKCEELLKNLKNDSESTPFVYMYFLGMELLANSFLMKDKEKSKKLMLKFFLSMQAQKKEDYLLFGLRGLINYYIFYKDSYIYSLIEENLGKLNMFKKYFKKYLYLDLKNDIKSLKELMENVNLI
ncbi:MAG: hypothetical protein QME48_05625 [bacterium]|nr:hypothetical protein [bacterium]